MLKIYYGSLEGELYSGNGYFDNWYDDSWLETEFAKRVIKESDKSELINPNLVRSPVLGDIPIRMISGSSKSLLIIKNTDTLMSIACMGANCYPFLAEIAREKDVLLTFDYYIDLYTYCDFGEVYVENVKRIVNNNQDLAQAFIDSTSEE